MPPPEQKRIDVSTMISVIASMLLCAGIVGQSVYYFFFNIPITEFLTLSEVLTLFAQEVMRYILVFFIIYVLTYLSNTSKTGFSIKRTFLRFVQGNSKIDRFKIYAIYRKNSMYFFVFGLISSVAFFQAKEKIAYIFSLYFSIEVLYFFVRFFRFEYLRELKLKKQLKKKYETFDITFQFALHFIFFIVIWSMIDVQRVKYQQKFINVSFKLMSDSLVKSDSSAYYIGQTDKFLFHYDSKKDKTTIYRKEDIKEIYFGKIDYLHFYYENKK